MNEEERVEFPDCSFSMEITQKWIQSQAKLSGGRILKESQEEWSLLPFFAGSVLIFLNSAQ